MTEEELAIWHFDELIKVLITFSVPAQRQKEIIGFGAVADEMAIDFDSHYTSVIGQLDERKLLTSEQKEELNKLDKFLDDRSGDKNPDFWDDDQLDINIDWAYVRKKSLEILKMLNKDNLDIKIERTVEHTKSDKGEPLVIERTFTKLVDKQSS